LDYRIVSAALGAGCLALILWIWRLRTVNAIFRAEVDELSRQLEQATQRLAHCEAEPKSKALATVVDFVATAGVPVLMLISAMSVSGFSGGAAITVALASLGGPAGMLGGIGLLVSVGIVLAKYGIVDLSGAVVRRLLETRSKAKIIQEIDDMPRMVPLKFRLKAKSLLDS
jgi:hypothetical protein